MQHIRQDGVKKVSQDAGYIPKPAAMQLTTSPRGVSGQMMTLLLRDIKT